MEQESLKMQISEILVEQYGIADANLVLNLTELLWKQSSTSAISINTQVIEEHRKCQRERDDYEARKIALESAVKTYGQTGGDLTENAVKYRKFLLDTI